MDTKERDALYIGGGLIGVLGVLWFVHNQSRANYANVTSPAAPAVLGNVATGGPFTTNNGQPILSAANGGSGTSDVQFPVLPGLSANFPNVPNAWIPQARVPGTGITIGPNTSNNAAPNLNFGGSTFNIGSGNTSGGSGACGCCAPCGCSAGDPTQSLMSFAAQLQAMMPALGPQSPYATNLASAYALATT